MIEQFTKALLMVLNSPFSMTILLSAVMAEAVAIYFLFRAVKHCEVKRGDESQKLKRLRKDVDAHKQVISIYREQMIGHGIIDPAEAAIAKRILDELEYAAN